MKQSESLLTLFIICLGLNFSNLNAQNRSMETPFEKNNLITATYDETIAFYKKLSENHDKIQMIEAGLSDLGKPIHLIIISKDGINTPSEIDRSKKTVLFINNAIHPGEPCGVDASMMMVRDFANKVSYQKHLEKTVIILIPIYNISGSLNRSSTSRANQLGPESYGFRGNIRHLDLNRDFIKTISKNAQTFNKIFSSWSPDLMIDNHTSNGADYQYTMTLIPTQKDKLEPSLSNILTNDMIPYFYAKMEKKSWDMTPYVYAPSTPDKGIMGFLDLPRYSSGYAALHQCISFMPETHMLKPYEDRVASTYAFMLTVIEYLDQNGSNLRAAKKAAIELNITKSHFDINWVLDKSITSQFLFKGFEAKYKKSLIHGRDRLYYDKNSPYEKIINFWNTYKTTHVVEKPKSYIIPQAYSGIIERLKNNGVTLNYIEKDTILDVTIYYIDNYETSKTAYEGRYLHSHISSTSKNIKRAFYKGDCIVHLNQIHNRYIIEVLEPTAPDSYFAWGFFDGILMQKEYFSPYVFEDLAVDILANNPILKEKFEQKKKEDKVFEADDYAQLFYIYKHSPYFEDSFKLYPIGIIR